MGKTPIRVEEENQDLISQAFLEDVTFDPEYVKNFFVSNLVQRTLAHVVGQGKQQGIRIRATETGALVVSPTGSAIEDNQTLTATIVGAAVEEETFDKVCFVVDVTVWDFDVLLRRSPDGERWGDWIERPANSEYSFDASTKMIEIKNKNADGSHDARYQLVGWY